MFLSLLDQKRKNMNPKFLVLVIVFVATVDCGKPSLSDNLGLFSDLSDSKFDFKSADYVYGTVWPKPQKEEKGSNIYCIDPADFL